MAFETLKEYYTKQIISQLVETKCTNAKILSGGLVVSCGKCPHCLSVKRQEWSFRLDEERKDPRNIDCFGATLTYDEEHLLFEDGKPVLNKKHVQDFLERLRDHLARKYNCTLKYYVRGEYGDLFGRPHYHSIFFIKRDLKKPVVAYNRNDVRRLVDELWPYGLTQTHVCVNGAFGMYIGKYVCDNANEFFHPGASVVPEFALMSRSEIIGINFINVNFNKLKAELDLCVANHSFISLHRFENGYVKPLPRSLVNAFISRLDCQKEYEFCQLYNLSSFVPSIKLLCCFNRYYNSLKKKYGDLNALRFISSEVDVNQCLGEYRLYKKQHRYFAVTHYNISSVDFKCILEHKRMPISSPVSLFYNAKFDDADRIIQLVLDKRKVHLKKRIVDLPVYEKYKLFNVA